MKPEVWRKNRKQKVESKNQRSGVRDQQKVKAEMRGEIAKGIRVQKSWDGLGKNQMIDWNSGRQRLSRFCYCQRSENSFSVAAKQVKRKSFIASDIFETAKRQGKWPHCFLFDLFTKGTAEAQAALDRNPVATSNQRAILQC